MAECLDSLLSTAVIDAQRLAGWPQTTAVLMLQGAGLASDFFDFIVVTSAGLKKVEVTSASLNLVTASGRVWFDRNHRVFYGAIMGSIPIGEEVAYDRAFPRVMGFTISIVAESGEVSLHLTSIVGALKDTSRPPLSLQYKPTAATNGSFCDAATTDGSVTLSLGNGGGLYQADGTAPPYSLPHLQKTVVSAIR